MAKNSDAFAKKAIVIFYGLLAAALLYSILHKPSPSDCIEKYLVYACNSRVGGDSGCGVFHADVCKFKDRDFGRKHTFVETLYLNSNVYICLDCDLESDFCYEISCNISADNWREEMEKSESAGSWDISLIKKLED